MPSARPVVSTLRLFPRWPVLCTGVLMLWVGLAFACRARSATGELTPPDDAVAWDASRYRDVFDDDYTSQSINLQGRAPHDVRDQYLLAMRLGNASIIAQVKVMQIWGKGPAHGRQQQYIEVQLEQILMGELVAGTDPRQLIAVDADERLAGSLQGRSLLMFLRWDPGAQPPYHHHLMPTDASVMTYIAALIEHAKEAGVLNEKGVPTGDDRRARARRSRAR